MYKRQAQGHLDLAAGNLIGGIAVQTMVLVICDIASGRERPLTFLVGALTPVLEGMLVVLVVSAVLMGALLEPSTAIGGVVSPASIAIVALWLAGVYVINRVRKGPRWSVSMPGARPGRRHRRERHPEKPHPFAALSTVQIAAIFVGACAVTLVAGVALAMSGNALADRAGINGVIFGGNAFQVCLFLLADVIAGTPVLPTAGRLNSWLASLGVALTAVYAIGIVARPQRCRARLGPDSMFAIAIFALGVAGLFVLPH